MNHDDEIIATLASALPDLLAVYRFGSHGSPSQRNDSDIDLAILGRRPFDGAQVWKLSQELAIKLGREVDLVDLATASTVLGAQIGFGNIAVHDYRKLSLEILRSILDTRLGDFRDFARTVIGMA